MAAQPGIAADDHLGRCAPSVFAAEFQVVSQTSMSVDEVIIPPSSGHVGLRLFAPERMGDGEIPGYFSVELGDPDSRARLRVYAYAPEHLAIFFSTLAKDWQGWAGEKTWESIEGEMVLRATTDRLGHITLNVRLTAPPSPPAWRFEGNVLIEAGMLEGLAARVRDFVGAG